MARTSNIFARVEPDIKEQAEDILTQLGIPMSNAISLFLRQVVMQRGIPFELKLSDKTPLLYGAISENEFNIEIEKGFDDLKTGNVISASELAENMKRDYNI